MYEAWIFTGIMVVLSGAAGWFLVKAQRREAEATDRLESAQDLLDMMVAAPPRIVTTKVFAPDDKQYLAFLHDVCTSDMWRWFLVKFREQLIQQAVDGARGGNAESRDLYLGALIGLDVMCGELGKHAEEYKGLTDHGSDDEDEE